MSWKDPDSPWVRAMKRKYWYRTPLSFSALFGIFFLIGMVILIWIAIASHLSAVEILIWAILIMTGCGIISHLISEVTSSNSDINRLWRFVPQADGCVCPHCRKKLNRETMQCSSCKTTYDLSLLQAYWMQAAYDDATAWPYLEDAADQSYKDIQIHIFSHVKPPRNNPNEKTGLWAYGLLAFGVFFLLAISVLAQTTNIITAQLPVWGFLLLRNRNSRKDDALCFCAECEYQQTPDVDEQPEQCPECGSHWLEDGNYVFGTKIDRPWRLWLGIFLIIFGLFWHFYGMEVLAWTFTSAGFSAPAFTNPGSCECP